MADEKGANWSQVIQALQSGNVTGWLATQSLHVKDSRKRFLSSQRNHCFTTFPEEQVKKAFDSFPTSKLVYEGPFTKINVNDLAMKETERCAFTRLWCLLVFFPNIFSM